MITIYKYVLFIKGIPWVINFNFTFQKIIKFFTLKRKHHHSNELVSDLASSLNCPMNKWNHENFLRSTSNSLHVCISTSWSCGKSPWSRVGKRWCNVCSPNIVRIMNCVLPPSMRSTVAPIWNIPKSSDRSSSPSWVISGEWWPEFTAITR